MTTLSSLLILIVIVVQHHQMAVQAQCPCNTTANWQFMSEFFSATGSKWQPAVNKSKSICDWAVSSKIVCNSTILAGIDLRNRNLQGSLNNLTFLAAFRNLSGLLLFDVRDNNLLQGNVTSMTFPVSLQTIRLPQLFLGSSLPEGLPNLEEWTCVGCTGMQGSLPSSWCGSKRNLQIVQLGSSAISGTIPPSWSSCPINTLDLSNTNITGEISSVWFSSASPFLQTLKLSNCQLNGTLPNNVTAPQLVSVDLSNNFFSGPLPDDLGAKLVVFQAPSNAFTGTLPSSLPPNMLTLDVSNNTGITGTIPRGWGAGLVETDELPQFFRTIHTLSLGGCSLNGSLPRLWLSSPWLESLQVVNVSRNDLSGTIAANISVPFLSTLDLSSNRFSGTLPLQLNTTFLAVVNISFNVFSGSLFTTVPTTLQILDASNNNLSGKLMFWNASFTMLNISRNMLNNTLPSPWVGGSQTVDISLNNITGALPSGTVIAILYASSNRLTLPAPTKVGPSSSFTYIDLRNNGITGALTSNEKFTNLQTLDISHNLITSMDRTTLQRMPRVTQILASHNRIVTLPSYLPDNTQLLDVSFNSVVGLMPGLWTWVYALKLVNLSYNVMNSTLVPKQLCRRLMGPQLIVFPGGNTLYPQISIHLTNASVKFAHSNVFQQLKDDKASSAWIRSWCQSSSVSHVLTASEVLTPTNLPPRTPTLTKKATRSPTASIARMSHSIDHSPTRRSISRSSSVVVSHSHRTLTRSHDVTPSLEIWSLSSSMTMLTTESDSLTAPLSKSSSRTVRPTGSLGSPSSSRTRESSVTDSVTMSLTTPRTSTPTLLNTTSLALLSETQSLTVLASRRSASLSSTFFCGAAVGILANSSKVASLYDVFTKAPMTLSMSWTGGQWGQSAHVLSATTSWGSVQIISTALINTTVRTTLALSAPTALETLLSDVAVDISVALMWEPDGGIVCSCPATTVHVLLVASIPSTSSELQTGANVVSSVAAPLASAAASIQVSLLQLQLSFCEFSDAASLSIAESPTRLQFGATLGAPFRGGIIGNELLMVAALILGHIVSAAHHVLRRTETVFFSQALLRFPGRCFVVFAFLLQPTIACGVALLKMPTASVGDYVLGVFALVSQTGVIAYTLWRTSTFIPFLKPLRNAPQGWLDVLVGRRTYWVASSGERDQQLHEAKEEEEASLVIPRHAPLYKKFGVRLPSLPVTRLNDSDDDEDDEELRGPARVAFLEANRYEYLTGRTAPKRHWYFAVDFLYSVAFGVISGLRPSTPDGCFNAQVGLTVVSALQFALVLLLRPFSSHTDVFFVAMISFMSAGAGVCMIVGAPIGSDVLSYVQLCTVLLRSGLRIVYVFLNGGAWWMIWDDNAVDANKDSREEDGPTLDDLSSQLHMPSSSFNVTDADMVGSLLGPTGAVNSLMISSFIDEEEVKHDMTAADEDVVKKKAHKNRPASPETPIRPVINMTTSEMLDAIISDRIHRGSDALAAPVTHFTARNRLKNAVLLILRKTEEVKCPPSTPHSSAVASKGD